MPTHVKMSIEHGMKELFLNNNQKQQNFLKITNSGAATQQQVVQFV